MHLKKKVLCEKVVLVTVSRGLNSGHAVPSAFKKYLQKPHGSLLTGIEACKAR